MAGGDGRSAGDSYTELATLGQGASGQVILARHDSSHQLVAIKRLAPRLARDPAFLARFREEAEVLRRLRHPNIAGLHWYVEREGEAMLAMEAVNGVPLRRLLETGPTGPESALVVLQGSLRGLQHAHTSGIVHRDYKPENVMVEPTGNSRLIDFGIAVPAGRGTLLAGTPRYMAPEQWRTGEVAPPCDVYAATAVCFECLVGEPPFTAQTLVALRDEHLHAPVALDRLPEPLRPLVGGGMAKNPSDRYRSAGALLAELEVVAGATYGPDWAARGQRVLAATVGALAGLVPVQAAAAAETGSSGGTAIATTVLGQGGAGWWRRHRRIAASLALPCVVAAMVLVIRGGLAAGQHGAAAPPTAVIGTTLLPPTMLGSAPPLSSPVSTPSPQKQEVTPTSAPSTTPTPTPSPTRSPKPTPTPTPTPTPSHSPSPPPINAPCVPPCQPIP